MTSGEYRRCQVGVSRRWSAYCGDPEDLAGQTCRTLGEGRLPGVTGADVQHPGLVEHQPPGVVRGPFGDAGQHGRQWPGQGERDDSIVRRCSQVGIYEAVLDIARSEEHT